jgi:hypothetical protein
MIVSSRIANGRLGCTGWCRAEDVIGLVFQMRSSSDAVLPYPLSSRYHSFHDRFLELHEFCSA